MMIIVALVAITIWCGITMRQRSLVYQEKARLYAELWEFDVGALKRTQLMMADARQESESARRLGDELYARAFDDCVKQSEKLVHDEEASVREFGALKRKYQHAARHPWEPVSPESPDMEMLLDVQRQVIPGSK
ncbi:MAG TPA: hypothetical protein VGZ22_08145 [Isosphaeraceae bacterium]|jgi:hypothetical protein|nr:hypothetical protein [Isosphaeraceae bacterium]